MNISKLIAFAAFAAANLALATPAITGVTAQQRYPWNGKVDITYTVSGDIAATAMEQGLITSLKVTAKNGDTGQSYTASSLSGDASLADGTHSIVWDMGAQGLAFVSTNVVFSVSCETTPATYCVIDLSAGKNASSYPVDYLSTPPSGGFNTDVYKTTKLVLRRIEPGSFMMGGTIQTTLTKPYYIGIFEMTQKQAELISGWERDEGDMCPVAYITYQSVRGSSVGTNWPSSSAVDSNSFMGKLRTRTGLSFDLPTEAQWEFACRAGTTSKYNNGGNDVSDLKKLGRYGGNIDDKKGGSYLRQTTVGSYLPNAWGLYDMHGNVSECCLDRYGSLAGPQTDPKGSSSGTNRVSRGGSFNSSPNGCTSSSRSYYDTKYVGDYRRGFRLARSLSSASSKQLCSGNSPKSYISLSSGTRIAATLETIHFSTAWENSSSSAQVVIAVNGEIERTFFGSGSFAWQPTSNGTYTLTHRILTNGEQVGTTLMATFDFEHYPAVPDITPATGTILTGITNVVISCVTDGETIYYTTDGSEPTVESTGYRRFRVSGRTTVKAIAVKNGLCSKTAIAEYATGQSANPVITPADGSNFNWSGQSVSIAWEPDAADNGVLRYTTDGSDPTASSPVYNGPFTIDDSTVVKAKAFGDQYFDSAIVTANLTRVWATVATPTITAASSFTGSETKVSLSCATPGATIYYTLNGSDPNSHSTRYTGPFYVTDSCTVKAYATCYDYLDSAVTTQIIAKVWGIGDTVGAPDHTFTTGGDLPFVRVTDNTAPLGESMKSGAITHSQTSTLSTTVMGPGTISFQWKTSCEKDPDNWYEWDHAEFSLDGTVVARLDGESGWQTVSQTIAGEGTHTLLWKYVKDDVESEGGDCCWVADYRWTSAYTATQTTPAPVPNAWLRGFFPHTPDEYDTYESAAKEDAANGLNKVWECYVAGLNPTNATDVFRTVISIGADGEPVIGWEPKLSAADEAKRTYTIYGRESLTEGSWGPTNAASRFFRVKVSMP